MHTNAIETWLARMHRHALGSGEPVDWWFHVQLAEPGRLETTYPECVSRIIRSPYTLSDGMKFWREFYKLCKRARFDVVHVHADLMSAPYLLAARMAGPCKIIVHVHNADENIPTPNRTKAALIRALFRRLCLALADRIVGNSNHALDTFLAGRRRRQERDLVHYYGIDPAPFEAARADPLGFRRELGFPEDARILLFLGRLVPEKNPVFALEVIAALRQRDARVFGAFVGAGSLEAELHRRAAELGVAHAIRHLGWRSDVAEVMTCCDWFILPHPEQPLEGFGIAVVESQLAGLRLLLSGIADDPVLPTASMRRLTLSDRPALWADAAIELWQAPAPSREATLRAFGDSPMDMDAALENMMRLHRWASS